MTAMQNISRYPSIKKVFLLNEVTVSSKTDRVSWRMKVSFCLFLRVFHTLSIIAMKVGAASSIFDTYSGFISLLIKRGTQT